MLRFQYFIHCLYYLLQSLVLFRYLLKILVSAAMHVKVPIFPLMSKLFVTIFGLVYIFVKGSSIYSNAC